jgi:replication-associated recombination protein RarA
MKNLLLSEKWRPKTIDEMVILPRIRKIFEKGLNQNVILYGHFGTGKTTLARILIGKYSKNSPYIELNSSFYTSIETLRNKIDDFCLKFIWDWI